MSKGNYLNTGRKIRWTYVINGQEFDGITNAAKHYKVTKKTIHTWVKNPNKPECYRKEKVKQEISTQEIESGAKKAGMDSLDFMRKIMMDEDQDIRLRAQMAKELAPYEHPKLTTGNKGKKEERDEKAKEAGKGKFSAGKSPIRLVK